MSSRQKHLQLIVALNDKNNAIGELFWDDGESECMIQDK
jgi:hypothetical protein